MVLALGFLSFWQTFACWSCISDDTSLDYEVSGVAAGGFDN